MGFATDLRYTRCMKNLLTPRIVILAGIAVAIVLLALWLRTTSGEDTWLCVDGQWTKHGNPSAPMPETPCKQAAVPTLGRTSLPAAEKDQPMKSYVANDFSFSHPDWPLMEKETVLEPERARVAVRNAGCGLIVTARVLPAGEQFQTALEGLLSEQVAQANVRILRKEITQTTSHIEGEFAVGGGQFVHTDQYGFVTSKNQFYSVVFAAEKTAFDTACKPFVSATVKSVQVK